MNQGYATPAKGSTKTVGEKVKSRNKSKPSTRRNSPHQKQQEFIHLADVKHSNPLDDLSEGDLYVADAEAEHMVNFVKIVTRQEPVVDNR